MKFAFIPLLALVVVLSGCTAAPGQSFELLISDQPTEVDAFDSLIVHITGATLFSQGEPISLEIDAEVDLTQVVGDNALSVFTGTIPAGTYQKLSLDISSVEGIVAGEVVDVSVPSNTLMVTKSFTVGEEPVLFVYDISIVKAGQSGKYNLLPIISETGVIGKDIPAGKIEKGEIGAEMKMIHANAIIERARSNLQKGNDLLDKEQYPEAAKAFEASERGFAIAQLRYEAAQAAVLGEMKNTAATGLAVASQSGQAASKLSQAVKAYQSGENARATTLGNEALVLFEAVPALPVVGVVQ